jgi:hypothetical protein
VIRNNLDKNLADNVISNETLTVVYYKHKEELVSEAVLTENERERVKSLVRKDPREDFIVSDGEALKKVSLEIGLQTGTIIGKKLAGTVVDNNTPLCNTNGVLFYFSTQEILELIKEIKLSEKEEVAVYNRNGAKEIMRITSDNLKGYLINQILSKHYFPSSVKDATNIADTIRKLDKKIIKKKVVLNDGMEVTVQGVVRDNGNNITHLEILTFAPMYISATVPLDWVVSISSSPVNIVEKLSKESNSPSVNPGGIDFRGLPITRQPALSLGGVPLGEKRIALAGIVPVGNIDQEWLEIQKMLDAGIVPSAGRIKEYLENCCGRDDFDGQIDKVLNSLADILRLEEEEVLPTESAFKEILVVLESGRTGAQIRPMLNQIVAFATEPQLIAR